MAEKNFPIAVFDSGIGGLTVLQALTEQFPDESYVYLGDTARLPYGTKSPETVRRYSESLTRILLRYNPKAIVIACNTASTHAYDAVCAMVGPVPVIGMIEPPARAAHMATRNGHIGVMATYGTVRSGAYEKQIKKIDESLRVSSVACQMLVALAEEGWAQSHIAKATLHEYLDSLFNAADAPDTLILGCTHFPVFENLIRQVVGDQVTLINSGRIAAQSLVHTIPLVSEVQTPSSLRFLATDDPERFAANAAKFFNRPLNRDDVELIDITA